jgi:hypothetical protein
MKSRKIRLAGHVALMEERRGVYRVLVGTLGGNRPLGISRRDEWIVLKWIFRK